VSIELLSAKWVTDAAVVYIGQGGDLHRRIGQLARFGLGRPVGHWGGRYLWQLSDCGALTIAWRPDPAPLATERELLDRFMRRYGRLPFANLR
jgi:hypothetical protein